MYWPSIQTISAEELPTLTATPGAATSLATPKAVATQPALELGTDSESRLRLLHEPELVIVDAEGNPGQTLELTIDRHRADLEGSLLQAAAANATIQLGKRQPVKAHRLLLSEVSV